MIHAIGQLVKAKAGQITLDLDADFDDLKELEGKKVSIDLAKYFEKRSLNANAYFWKLCDMIAKKIGTDKDSVYLLMLTRYGVFDMIDVIDKAADQITKLYRYSEEEYAYEAEAGESIIRMVGLKCYKGSHEYDSKEMADLINGTVSEAQELGISTWNEEEISNLVKNWREK